MADPISIIGLCVTVVTCITELNSLLGKYQDAEPAVNALVVQTRMISAAVEELKTRVNDTARLQISESTRLALQDCLKATAAEVKTLTKYVGRIDQQRGGMRSRDRVRHVWTASSLETSKGRLRDNVQALSFLLHVLSLTPNEQSEEISKQDLITSIRRTHITGRISSSPDQLTDGTANASEVIFDAVQRDDIAEVRRLARSGHTVNSVKPIFGMWDDGTPARLSPLSLATWRESVDMVETLLQLGAEVQPELNPHDSTPILLASHKGHAELVKVLLKAGADANSLGINGGTPLGQATQSAGCTKLLLEGGARVNTQTAYKKRAALMIAARQGTPEVVECLIQAGADTSLRDSEGRTALHDACSSGQIRSVRLLIDKVGNIDAVDQKGGTALHNATSARHAAAIELLVQGGANPDARDTQGYAPLHKAAAQGSVEVVNALLSNGADIALRTNNGFTPTAIAAERSHAQLVEFLIPKDVEHFKKARQKQLDAQLIAETDEWRKRRESAMQGILIKSLQKSR